VLTDLVPALAAAGEYELAQTTAISLGDANWKRKALTGLSNAFAAADEYDRANAAAISITGPRARAEAMAGLVEALAATNSQPKHDLAQTTAMAIADPYWKVRAITAVASAFTADGDLERARRLADLALATAASVTRLEERVQALASLTEVLATAGEYKGALTAATKITDPNGQAEALTTLATVMTRKGDIRQSRQALAQAWAVGNWEIPLPALAEIDAEVLQQLVEVEAPRRSQ
jgi:tetratricopeptide (TPR) repeat protein